MATQTRTPRMLTPAETADVLAVDERTLRGWREAQSGPAFVRLSRRTVRYDLGDVLAWLNSRREAS